MDLKKENMAFGGNVNNAFNTFIAGKSEIGITVTVILGKT